MGLELDDDRSRMAGEVDGVKIRIAMVEADWRASTVVSADLLEPLPAGTRIYKRAHPSDPKVGDLILDSGIAVACEDLAVLRRRLGTDDARAVLMEVIHGARGEIRYDKIRIEWSGRAGPELVPAVHQVVELAQALAVLPH